MKQGRGEEIQQTRSGEKSRPHMFQISWAICVLTLMWYDDHRGLKHIGYGVLPVHHTINTSLRRCGLTERRILCGLAQLQKEQIRHRENNHPGFVQQCTIAFVKEQLGQIQLKVGLASHSLQFPSVTMLYLHQLHRISTESYAMRRYHVKEMTESKYVSWYNVTHVCMKCVTKVITAGRRGMEICSLAQIQSGKDCKESQRSSTVQNIHNLERQFSKLHLAP